MNWLGDHWVDLLGWGGSALLVYSILQTRLLRLRALNLVASISLLVFNALIEVWPMVAMNATLAAINSVKIFQLLRQQHDEAIFDVIEVRPESLYLQHILDIHRDDIARFQPGLDWQPGRDGSHAFVVVKGDETVGVGAAPGCGRRRARPARLRHAEVPRLLPRRVRLAPGRPAAGPGLPSGVDAAEHGGRVLRPAGLGLRTGRGPLRPEAVSRVVHAGGSTSTCSGAQVSINQSSPGPLSNSRP